MSAQQYLDILNNHVAQWYRDEMSYDAFTAAQADMWTLIEQSGLTADVLALWRNQ